MKIIIEPSAMIYNVAGRVAIAAFPALLPMCVYWLFGQEAMVNVGQAWNLTSYVTVLGLSGYVLPLRDFRTMRNDAFESSIYYNAYIRLSLWQTAIAAIVLFCLLLLAREFLPSIKNDREFFWTFVALGTSQIGIILCGPLIALLLANNHHLLPNATLVGSRAAAIGALIFGAFAGLSLSQISAAWICIFAAIPIYLWHATFQVRQGFSIHHQARQALISIIQRSGLFAYWSLMAMIFYSAPLTYIAYRWPSDFGGMNYAFLLGSATTTLVTAALIPYSNHIQDKLGQPYVIESLNSFVIRFATVVFALLLMILGLTWPIHNLIIGEENTELFRLATPLVLLATTLRLLTWSSTQCAIAAHAEAMLIVAPLVECAVAVISVLVLSDLWGVLGVPTGLVTAAALRLCFTYIIDLPRIKMAWMKGPRLPSS
jgi:hypothetical protein